MTLYFFFRIIFITFLLVISAFNLAFSQTAHTSKIPIKEKYEIEFKALIRKVEIINKSEKIPVYEGFQKQFIEKYKTRPTFKYKDRNLHFEYSAPFYDAESRTLYQFRLIGYDDDWSKWSTEAKKDYTNLDGGMYTFTVRAKNVYGTISKEDYFHFKVLYPWYRTFWAYLFYLILIIIIMVLVIRWRLSNLKREKQKLEFVVKERTKEIEERNKEIYEKNIQLESQTIQLTEQSERLQEMDKVKSLFFANISHEFRTPLTLIMGPLEQMMSECTADEKEKKRKLLLMLRNAQRLLRLINQLLELSKLDSGKMELHAEKLDIISFLKGITDSFKLFTQRNELELVFRAETEPENQLNGFWIYIDPRKMEDVLSNLLANAIKFTPPGGEIRVSVKRNKSVTDLFPSGSIEIIVSDTGPGIPGDQITHLFDRFYQANSTFEYHAKGTGIGLALSKELVELHNGNLTVKSKAGEGSSFIVTLPLGKSHLSPNEHNAVSSNYQQQSTLYSKTDEYLILELDDNENNKTVSITDADTNTADIILVVEDSPDMRTYIKSSLSPSYIIYEASNGREGIQKARELIPDLVISDIMMPEMNGYELCRELKSDVYTSHIPIILLTAKASEESIIQGLEAGVDDYITKPFNTKILLARIKNLIEIRSQLQKNINREMSLQPVKTSISTIDRDFLKDLHTVINKNLSDSDFNVEAMCKRLFMGRTTLYRKILALTGETPTEFIRSYRLKKGAELLKHRNETVLEVAFEVGFNNSSYFAKCFKERFHQLPSEYQAAHKH